MNSLQKGVFEVSFFVNINQLIMKLSFTFVIIFIFSLDGFCQKSSLPPRNAIFGQFKYNQAAPSVSLFYERIIIRKDQLGYGLFFSLNATNYREYYRPNYTQPSFSAGIIISKILNRKNKLEAMMGTDFYPFSPKVVYFHGKFSYEYFLPKPKIGFRGFVMVNLDTDYKLFVENPSLSRRQIIIPSKLYWSVGAAIGKYF
jgi:hypothetical protein